MITNKDLLPNLMDEYEYAQGYRKTSEYKRLIYPLHSRLGDITRQFEDLEVIVHNHNETVEIWGREIRMMEVYIKTAIEVLKKDMRELYGDKYRLFFSQNTRYVSESMEQSVLVKLDVEEIYPSDYRHWHRMTNTPGWTWISRNPERGAQYYGAE